MGINHMDYHMDTRSMMLIEFVVVTTSTTFKPYIVVFAAESIPPESHRILAIL
jgi:hypothetical protein